MTAERRPAEEATTAANPTSTATPEVSQADEEALLDVAYEGDEYGDEEIDDLDDEDEPSDRRGWPLGAMLLFAVGIWVGRWVSQLPVDAQDTVGLLLVVVTAILGAGLYRRWVRKQMAQARARRARR